MGGDKKKKYDFNSFVLAEKVGKTQTEVVKRLKMVVTSTNLLSLSRIAKMDVKICRDKLILARKVTDKEILDKLKKNLAKAEDELHEEEKFVRKVFKRCKKKRNLF